MPLTTRNQARKQSQSQSNIIPKEKNKKTRENLVSLDTVERCATMYPAFVTAPLPTKVLDELIEEAKNGLCGMMMDDRGVPGECLCILDTEDLDSVTHGSRKPMQPFESPFLGMTDDEVRSWMSEHRHPNFAESTFAVLDGDTAKNKTCRIGVTDIVQYDVDRMITTDFYGSMYVMVPVEAATVSWFNHEEFYLGSGKVLNREYIDGLP
ncbi:hypothetical protein V497_01540 [Pseudogymnoascus sp. VKM F-4516 (FW-969)]|nr:hypothetical protein V497_01540 [Pseudogymnoascus sp. VKM F-4516 (FW-969)]